MQSLCIQPPRVEVNVLITLSTGRVFRGMTTKQQLLGLQLEDMFFVCGVVDLFMLHTKNVFGVYIFSFWS